MERICLVGGVNKVTKKLTDEELEQKVKELETEIGRLKKEGKALQSEGER